MGENNWDAALVVRANELLTEVRRYHVDAEATRLQLSSAAASITRKVDELPSTVRQLVEESLQKDMLNAERPIIAKRLDLATRMLNDLSTQFHVAGLSFLGHMRRLSIVVIVFCSAASIAMAWWSIERISEVSQLSSEISSMQKKIFELHQIDGKAAVKTCVDSASRARLCVKIDESAGKFKDSYYVIAR